MTPRIIVTCGDVHGIGLECFFKAIRTAIAGIAIDLAVNPVTLARYLEASKQDAVIDGSTLIVGETMVNILPVIVEAPIEFGRLSSVAGAHAMAALDVAAAAVAAGRADAVVTLPINKEACALAGSPFPGQTEFFGDRWGGTPLMILMHGSVRVALATVHIPVRTVSHRLTIDHVSERIVALARSLQNDLAIESPSIAVLGLNPHAGENGTIGQEEGSIIEPAIKAATIALEETAVIDGPLPADGFFGFGSYRKYDGILAMYHDQGLIPLKLLANGGGVNFTAGLRHVRTSPDHGTAFDIAGKNIADPSSTIEAIRMAATIVQNRRAQD
ncbi:MAG: 4-hydroxythreonine-4-phosphate dehydrogenase PdxA [Ignavibacteriae bacterium]|nr:MAG: 4-hydroxythreonine-4-phosphate dehydrogenase PdxA [Ignavibacteriota bacterium]